MVVGLQQTSYSVGEGSGPLSVCVLLTGSAERDVLVSLLAISQTAQGRVQHLIPCLQLFISILYWHSLTVARDYAQPTPMELTFLQGTSQQCANISISDDAILENNEFFSVQLTTTDQAVTLSPSSATVTIGDDDSKLFLCISIPY